VLSRADNDGHFDELVSWRNPFDVKFGLDETDEDNYEPFNLTELAKLLASPVFASAERPVRGRGETAKWAPLFALFHGPRRTELLQLLVRDIAKDPDTGIWTVRFKPERPAGQRIKNPPSLRRVPIHPQLLSMGFERFLSARLSEVGADGSLWPGFEDRRKLKSRMNRWGEWFSGYLAKQVVNDPMKKFHSFRGTFKRFAREAGVETAIIDRLCGHSLGNVGARYGRKRDVEGGRDTGYPLTRLVKEVARVRFGSLDWHQLK
jgi:integrase